MQPEPTASSTIDIAADPADVYMLITDLDTLAELADETEAISWAGAVTTVAPGAVFRGSNRNGWHRWTTTCTVTAAQPGRRFGFDVTHTRLPIAGWRYDIEPSATGCTVTESTWDRRPGWFARLAFVGTGVADRTGANQRHIEATLARLKARAEAPPARSS